jgi:tRNA dimethylallyltransferase
MPEPTVTVPSLDPVLIAGPTAVGKSAVALRLAETIGGEVVSVDSMQVYRGLDIGTAKPMAPDRSRVPHHLIDMLDLDQNFDAAEFVRHASSAIEDIRSRGKAPVLCGGTGLYFSALAHGLGEAPPSDPALRAELEQIAQETLLEELARRDPQTHEVIDRMNRRRVIRAVEVLRLTGRPFSAQRGKWPGTPAGEKTRRAFLIMRSRHDLHNRINERVDRMFAAGLVDETRRLLEGGLEKNRNAMQALGYRQVVEYLHGARPLPETIELVKIRTGQFAKRQMTWFKKYFHGEKIELSAGEYVEDAVKQIRTFLG